MELITVFTNVINPVSLALIFLGVAVGLIFGVIPGLNTPIAMALALPFTFSLETVHMICLIMGIYMGGVSGGLVTAIMLKIPGNAAAMATTFDGYPMALKGRGLQALQIGTFASFFGGVFSCLALMFFSPLLAKAAIGFGPWEYFGSSLLALSLVCVLARGNLVKGFITMGLGLLFTSVGMSPIDGIATRFTFGNYFLENGFELIAIVIGVFAVPELIKNTGHLDEKVVPVSVEKRWFYMLPWRDIKKFSGTFVRSGIIGTLIGIIPGMGAGPAGLLSYEQAKKLSKDPEEFGKGNPFGVAAAESANNATTGGALTPMLALGIPGDTTTAIILGAFAMQGITTGPLLNINYPVLFKTIIFSVLVANFVMFIVQAGTIRYMAKIIQVPRCYLIPVITVFCITGIICLNNSIFDAYCTLGFIFLGYLFQRNNYPVVPLILGAVLGGIIETNLRISISYYGSFLNCLTRFSLGSVFFAIAAIIPASYIILNLKRRPS